MPRSIPNEMPQTIEGWNQMCEDIHFNEVEAYEEAVAKAKEDAEKAFNKEAPALRADLISQMEDALKTAVVETSEGAVPLTEEQIAERKTLGIAEIDKVIAQKLQEAIDQSTFGIQEPQTLEQIQTTYSFGRPQENIEEYVSAKPMQSGFSGDAYYELADGRIYSVRKENYLEEGEECPYEPIPVPGGTEEDLRKVLDFYINPPKQEEPVIGDVLLTDEEVIERKITNINTSTSKSIIEGFDYTIKGQTLHFPYDEHDQQNFTDKANQILLAKVNGNSLPDVDWKAYTHDGTQVNLKLTGEEFLDLYVNGALDHKDVCLALGLEEKASL